MLLTSNLQPTTRSQRATASASTSCTTGECPKNSCRGKCLKKKMLFLRSLSVTCNPQAAVSVLTYDTSKPPPAKLLILSTKDDE